MLTCFNVKKTHYFSNTVHYCSSSMPRLSQTLHFLQAPPSDKHSLLWLANWHSVLWLAEHHKPCLKCNAPFHNRELQLSKFKVKTVNNVLSFTISSSPSRVTDTVMKLLCVCTQATNKTISDRRVWMSRSGILSMHNQLVTLQRERKTWNRTFKNLTVCTRLKSCFSPKFSME